MSSLNFEPEECRSVGDFFQKCRSVGVTLRLGVQTIVLLAWSLSLELLSQRSAGVQKCRSYFPSVSRKSLLIFNVKVWSGVQTIVSTMMPTVGAGFARPKTQSIYIH